MPSSNGQVADENGAGGEAQAAAVAKTVEVKSWPCHMCSYENLISEMLQQCQICSTPRLITPPATTNSSSNEWPCSKCTFLNKAE